MPDPRTPAEQTPDVGSMNAPRIVVGVGDMAVSRDQKVIVSTYALGSCVGIVAFDPVAHAGGILHIMLPYAQLSPDKAQQQPAMFADTGLAMFFKALQMAGADAARTRILLAGGAAVISGDDIFKIGERNIEAVEAILARNGFRPHTRDLGGMNNRTVHLVMKSGLVELKLPAGKKHISLA